MCVCGLRFVWESRLTDFLGNVHLRAHGCTQVSVSCFLSIKTFACSTRTVAVLTFNAKFSELSGFLLFIHTVYILCGNNNSAVSTIIV